MEVKERKPTSVEAAVLITVFVVVAWATSLGFEHDVAERAALNKAEAVARVMGHPDVAKAIEEIR